MNLKINRDGVPWIHKCVEYFPNALYTYDRYHLKSWIRRAFTNRTTQERKRAYVTADRNDPLALVVAIAEAELAENDEGKKKEISDLRQFILDNMEALRDYRESIQSRNEYLDTSWMRPMGSAESNMNLFSKRLKKQGYSWSQNGLKAMLHGMIHHFEGTLLKVLGVASSTVNLLDNQLKKQPSFASLLTERSQPSIGAIQGRMPALASSYQSKPYAQTLRGLAGLSSLK